MARQTKTRKLLKGGGGGGCGGGWGGREGVGERGRGGGGEGGWGGMGGGGSEGSDWEFAINLLVTKHASLAIMMPNAKTLPRLADTGMYGNEFRPTRPV